MLILNADDVRHALPMRDAVEGMKRAFSALSEGRAVVPHRVLLPVDCNAGISLFMPSFVDDPDRSSQALVVKAVSLFDGNRSRGLPRIQAAVLVLEPDTGRPVALLEGSTLTAIRTGAAAGAATDLLSRPDSCRLAVFGAGVQARTQIEAVCAVRRIERVTIFGPTPENVAALLADVSTRLEPRPTLAAAASAREALDGADIICTATTSQTPVFDDADLPLGVHVNAVGSYQPHVREIPPETVSRATVVVDSRDAVWEEAGDLIQPLNAGLIARDHVRAELGEVVLGRAAGRRRDDEITLFKSVGVAVQDAIAAQIAMLNAVRRNVGANVAW